MLFTFTTPAATEQAAPNDARGAARRRHGSLRA
jgi:hypothetical protein